MQSSGWTWPASPRPCRAWSATVKEREAQGWSFEAADASLELLMRGALGGRHASLPFALESYRVLTEHRRTATVTSPRRR